MNATAGQHPANQFGTMLRNATIPAPLGQESCQGSIPMRTTNASVMEFHVSRTARDRYQFSETLFALSGNVIIANFHAARLFAQKMNDQRDLVRFPEQTVKAGHINAMGLIDEILHFVAGLYCEQKKPDAMELALHWLETRYGRATVDKA